MNDCGPKGAAAKTLVSLYVRVLPEPRSALAGTKLCGVADWVVMGVTEPVERFVERRIDDAV